MDGWPDDTSRALIDAIAIADSDDSLKVSLGKAANGLRHQRWNASSVAAVVEPSGGFGWGSTLEDGC